ncbi:hypothetical protein LCGC14_1930180 [marine sediment metagenome]|uniref:Uncharacterized protein n=1 Tax=marine sediment metagenome TaxID=412755 RepID=A0A0F9IL04_9ZZZZ
MLASHQQFGWDWEREGWGREAGSGPGQDVVAQLPYPVGFWEHDISPPPSSRLPSLPVKEIAMNMYLEVGFFVLACIYVGCSVVTSLRSSNIAKKTALLIDQQLQGQTIEGGP